MAASRTDLVVLLDRSGSMETGRTDHEGGLRSFVRDQRDLAGDVRLTLVLFDTQDPFEVVYDRTPLTGVDEAKLVLVPRGGTPLLDALGLRIHHHTKRVTDAVMRPDMVIFVVITDGQENSSKKYTLPDVKRLVREREAVGWTFLYLGANVDAFAEAGALGINAAYSANYAGTRIGTQAAYAVMTENTLGARATLQATGNTAAAQALLVITDKQRKRMAAKDSDEVPEAGIAKEGT